MDKYNKAATKWTMNRRQAKLATLSQKDGNSVT